MNVECLKFLIFAYVSVLLGVFYAFVPFSTVDVQSTFLRPVYSDLFPCSKLFYGSLLFLAVF